MMTILSFVGTFAMAGEGISLQLQQVHKACRNNTASACFELGELYREGTGVERNITEAKEYYRKACSGGFDMGCLELEKLKDGGRDAQ